MFDIRSIRIKKGFLYTSYTVVMKKDISFPGDVICKSNEFNPVSFYQKIREHSLLGIFLEPKKLRKEKEPIYTGSYILMQQTFLVFAKLFKIEFFIKNFVLIDVEDIGTYRGSIGNFFWNF